MFKDRELTVLARNLFVQLRAKRVRLVLAESCTGGLVSAALTRIPGASDWFCGSAVVYQVETKAHWLEIPKTLLNDPGPVSAEVASRMAAGVLKKTPQADIAASVTGHLGPGAPKGLEGRIFLAFARRGARRSGIGICKRELAAETRDREVAAAVRRQDRQRRAAAHLLRWISHSLSES